MLVKKKSSFHILLTISLLVGLLGLGCDDGSPGSPDGSAAASGWGAEVSGVGFDLPVWSGPDGSTNPAGAMRQFLLTDSSGAGMMTLNVPVDGAAAVGDYVASYFMISAGSDYVCTTSDTEDLIVTITQVEPYAGTFEGGTKCIETSTDEEQEGSISGYFTIE